ncbi:MAG TPA: glycosyltransferase family 87 protein [Anaeromyxobacter sp.]
MSVLRVAERARERLAAFFVEPRNVAWTLLALSVVAAVQEYLLGPKAMGGGLYTHYNNYRIYERSFVHLLHRQDLYVRYPAEHFDIFKYSPTFAALMAPLSLLPDAAGIVLWNLLNAAVFVLALAKLPVLSERSKALLGLVLVPDFLTAVQNTQANVLVAGLVLLAFGLLERDRPGWAALSIACGLYVKLYPALGALVFLFYPRKLRFLASLAGWLLMLGVLPLLLVSPEALRGLYTSWFRLLFSDREVLTGLSVMGVLRGWFGLDPSKTVVVLLGGVVLLVPLVNVGAWARPTFRLLFLAALLVWMVIFNHASESATFFIAMCGVGLWYFARPRRPVEAALFGLAFLLTSMSPHFPDVLVQRVVRPYALKAVPCILVWLVLVYELVASRGEPAALVAAKRAARPA